MLTGTSPNLLIDPVLVVGTSPVLVEDRALTFPELATPLLVAAVAAVVLWVLVLLGWRSRPGPGASCPGRRPWTWAKSRRRWSIC